MKNTEKQSIDDYRRSLDAGTLELIDAARDIVAASHPGLSESIKWNAPSFAMEDEDRITLGVERKGGIRIVLHRGAKPKDLATYRFEDADHLAKWPAPDRGVIVFKTLPELIDKREALSRLCTRWVEQAG